MWYSCTISLNLRIKQNQKIFCENSMKTQQKSIKNQYDLDVCKVLLLAKSIKFQEVKSISDVSNINYKNKLIHTEAFHRAPITVKYKNELRAQFKQCNRILGEIKRLNHSKLCLVRLTLCLLQTGCSCINPM